MKVIIVGKSPDWTLAPQTGEVWGVNNICLKRDVSVVFNMHHMADLGSLTRKAIKMEDYARNNKVPYVTLEELPDIPTSVRYPIEKMHSHYFNNSIAYMIAYAVHKGATVIDIYGVQMAADAEYREQRPCCEYWIGYARGKGVEVNIHWMTTLFHLPGDIMYGYEKKSEDL